MVLGLGAMLRGNLSSELYHFRLRLTLIRSGAVS